jgi:membrane protein required for colicin V production
MHALDIIILILLGFGLVKGFFKGLFVELASLIGLVAGVYGAYYFSDYFANFLREHFNWNENYLQISAFAVTFLLILLSIIVAGKALTKLADFAALGLLNKFLGGLFGLLKMAVIIGVLIMLFALINSNLTVVKEKTLQTSIFYEPIKAIASNIFPDVLETIMSEKSRLQ